MRIKQMEQPQESRPQRKTWYVDGHEFHDPRKAAEYIMLGCPSEYFDEYLDTNHAQKNVIAVKILVAFGGPNIWIDTESRAVELYWWTDRASYPISGDACDALDDWAAEHLQC